MLPMNNYQNRKHTGISVCDQYEVDKVVCPGNLRNGVFTVGALDNLDHKPIINHSTRFISRNWNQYNSVPNREKTKGYEDTWPTLTN